jgi:hypothetical protein
VRESKGLPVVSVAQSPPAVRRALTSASSATANASVSSQTGSGTVLVVVVDVDVDVDVDDVVESVVVVVLDVDVMDEVDEELSSSPQPAAISRATVSTESKRWRRMSRP